MLISKAKNFFKAIKHDEFVRHRFIGAAQFWFVAAFWVAFLPLLHCLQGCQPKDTPPPAARNGGADRPKDPAPPKPGGPETRPALYLKATVRELPEPNRYAVDLEWKHTNASASPFIYRRGGGGEEIRIDAKEQEGRYTDEVLRPGILYEYLLAHQDNGTDVQILDKQALTIPRDLEVAKMEDFDSGRGVELNRVFFKENSVITLGERGVEMYANELVSSGAVLQSFVKGQKAPKGQHAFNAGKILISVKKARGALRIEAHGQDGGEGNDGAAGQNGGPGTSGAPGDWMTNPDWRKYATNSPENAAEHSRKYYLYKNDEFWWGQKLAGNQPAFMCKTPPTDGGPGEQGGPGQDGGDGGRGGDSARVHISVEQDSEFHVEVAGEPGLGAIGGRGGKGGVGGPGGPPGALDAGFRCPPAKQGPQGPPGVDGRQGRTGATGEKQPVCVKIGKEMSPQCPKNE